MAKLEGVKIVDMKDGKPTKITYEGAEYLLTDERAVAGDICFNIRSNSNGQQADSFYEVTKVDEFTRVKDDYGDDHGWSNDCQGDYFEIYRIEPTLKAGDFAKIRDVKGSLLGFKAGQVVELGDNTIGGLSNFEVESLDDGSTGFTDAYNLEPLTERELTFAKAGRKLDEIKNGDIVKFIGENMKIDSGTIGVVTEIDYDGTFRLKVPGITFGNWVSVYNVYLIAPVESRVDAHDYDV